MKLQNTFWASQNSRQFIALLSSGNVSENGIGYYVNIKMRVAKGNSSYLATSREGCVTWYPWQLRRRRLAGSARACGCTGSGTQGVPRTASGSWSCPSVCRW